MKVVEWLDFGIFPGHCMFVMGFTYDEVIEILEEKGAHDWIKGLYGWKDRITENSNRAFSVEIYHTETGDSKYLYYIFLKDFDRSDWAFCKLAHEVLHVCQFYLPGVLDRNREHEAEAYTHTHLMNQCLKAMQEG